MAPELTDAEEARFAALRERLDGVERGEPPEPDAMTDFEPLDPMLAEPFEGDLSALDADEWLAERKFDGTRILLEKFDGEVRLYTRRHVDRADAVPRVTDAARETLPDGLVLDGEVAFVDPDGGSVFVPIHGGEETIEQYDLTPVYYVFDVLVVDTEWVVREPLSDRRARIEDFLPDRDAIVPIAQHTGDLQAFYDDQVERDEEGIIVKRRDSPYHPNTRSSHWRKVKAFEERDAIAVGYTPGEGARSSTFGALVLTDGEAYVGRVGSGFTEAELSALLEEFRETDERPVPPSEVGSTYTPIEPIVVTVKYQEVTDNRDLRAPVFLGAKPGAPTDDVGPIEP